MNGRPSKATFGSLMRLRMRGKVPQGPFVGTKTVMVASVLLGRLGRPRRRCLHFIHSVDKGGRVRCGRRITLSRHRGNCLGTTVAGLLGCCRGVSGSVRHMLRFCFLRYSVRVDYCSLSGTFLPFTGRGRTFAFRKVALATSRIGHVGTVVRAYKFCSRTKRFSCLMNLPKGDNIKNNVTTICPLQCSITI